VLLNNATISGKIDHSQTIFLARVICKFVGIWALPPLHATATRGVVNFSQMATASRVNRNVPRVMAVTSARFPKFALCPLTIAPLRINGLEEVVHRFGGEFGTMLCRPTWI
jgi:hypothetical protein